MFSLSNQKEDKNVCSQQFYLAFTRDLSQGNYDKEERERKEKEGRKQKKGNQIGKKMVKLSLRTDDYLVRRKSKMTHKKL